MDDRPQPFTEHLRELRLRLRNALIALLVGCMLTFWWAEPLYALLARPLVEAWHQAGLKDPQLRFGSLTEPFWTYFELSIYSGLFLSSPFIFHQLWRFIAPGLYTRERRIAVPFALCSGLFFIGGALFCYVFVLPVAFKFFLSYATTNIGHIRDAFGLIDAQVTSGNLGVEPTLFMKQYLDLTTKMLLGFALIFELPLLIFFLAYAGIVTHRGLWKFNKYALILSFLVGGLLTPGPDIMSQLLMALPLIVLYNLSILVAMVVTRRRERDLAEPTPDGA